jgi:hypothetical protein
MSTHPPFEYRTVAPFPILLPSYTSRKLDFFVDFFCKLEKNGEIRLTTTLFLTMLFHALLRRKVQVNERSLREEWLTMLCSY